MREHDYLHCHDGDGCKECKIHEQGERLRELIKRTDPERKTRLLKELVKQMGKK